MAISSKDLEVAAGNCLPEPTPEAAAAFRAALVGRGNRLLEGSNAGRTIELCIRASVAISETSLCPEATNFLHIQLRGRENVELRSKMLQWVVQDAEEPPGYRVNLTENSRSAARLPDRVSS
ncbi:MAG TPA: hypothetical protein VLE93_01055 [Candidatus Saccharimonadales bacterium]|nr:hypothetical protein [Candidatus Saccharimonadales bacterium]